MSVLNEGGGVPAVMSVTPAGSSNSNGGCGWGGDWIAFIVLFLLFGMFGWGGFGGWGGGFGGGGYQQGYDTRADLQRGFDNQAVINKLDGITNGLCDGFYATNNAINGVGTTVMQGFSQAELSRCNQQAALMQQLNTMQYQAQDCCCQTQRAIDAVNYNLATQSCDTRNTIQNTTRDIIDNQNANARAVLDALTAQRIEAKDAKIAEQASLINALNLAQSQANQTTDIRTSIINELRNCPVGTYQVPNPNCCYGPWGGMNWNGFNGYNNGGTC